MTTDKTTRWTATSALTLSVLALGASLWSVGCQEDSAAKREPLTQVPVNQAPGTQAPATKPGAAKPGAAKPGAAKSSRTLAAKANPQSPAPAKKAGSTETGEVDDSGKLSLGRLVVTTGIEKREPVETESFEAGAGPVYAFVELANSRQNDSNVVVTFQHESGKKVGFINLSVPGKQKRWRTWGRTSQIKKPGKWTVVVADEQGTELDRKEFQVEAATDVPKKVARATK